MASLSARIAMLYAAQNGATRRDRLCGALRQTISEGSLPAGSQLPSSRLLAAELKLSRVTAEAAYSQLESEGYLRRKTGQGTFVAITLRPTSASASRTAAALPFTPSARAATVISSGGCQDPPFPYAFAAGSPELRAFPHDLWRRMTARQQKLHGSALMRYGDPQGWLPLRQALSTWLAQSRGVRCTPQQVIILTSSQQALQMLSLLLLDSGEEVWMENPGYPGARHAFHSAGARVTGVAVDEQGAIPVEGSPRLIYLTPSHQFPGGSALTLERRLAWLALAEKQQSWIIEDDYDSEFWYDAQPMPAMQGLAPQRTLYLGTFSKSLFPSLRLAWMVVPEPLVTPLIRLRSVMDGHSAQLPQAVTAEFIAQGHYAAHLRLMRQLYHSRRDLLQERLTALLPEQLEVLPCRGGLQMTVLLRQGDEATLTAQAAQQQLLLPRLGPCWLSATPQQQGWLLGFSALERAEIISGVNRLAALF